MDILAGAALAILLGGVLLQLVLGRVLGPRTKGWLAFVVGLGAVASILALLPGVLSGKPVDAAIGLQVHIDGLSLVFALMATGIGSAILLYSIGYMAHEEEGVTRFYALMLTFMAGLVGLVISASLLSVYFAWEVIGLCSYLLVGFWYKQPAAVDGARKVLVMTHIPGYALLIGILLLYSGSGTFLWTSPVLAAQFTSGIFLLMLVAAMAKSVMFPLHTWIPEAMNAPTPVSALLHSACYVKAGVYLVARLYSIVPWQPDWQVLVMALGCATMLVGAFFALAQTDLKRLLAFSTISQLGYITALGIGTPLGAAAAMFYVFSHGLFKGTLFMCAGAIQHAAGTRDLRQLGGLGSRMPHTARIWLVAAAAIIGVPLTNGFVAKWLLYDAALEAQAWPVVIIAWLVSALTAFYILKATVSIFFGEMPQELRTRDVKEAPPTMLSGMGFLAGLCVLFGIAPQILMSGLVSPAVAAMNFNFQVNLTFLGLHTVSANAPITAGALLALLALLAAGAVFLGARKPAVSNVPLFTGGDPLPESNTMSAEDFSELAQVSFLPVYNTANPDPAYYLLWRGIRGAARLAGSLAQSLESHPYWAMLAAGVLLAILILIV